MDIPSGIITPFAGAIIDIPAGWVLCDGTLGTPDLRNRFVPGAGGALAVGDTGGSATHTHTFSADPHDHTFGAGSDIEDGGDLSATTNQAVASGTTDAFSSNPLFHALAYIMKT